MYNAIVLPHFDYADVVYDAASETNKSRLCPFHTGWLLPGDSSHHLSLVVAPSPLMAA